MQPEGASRPPTIATAAPGPSTARELRAADAAPWPTGAGLSCPEPALRSGCTVELQAAHGGSGTVMKKVSKPVAPDLLRLMRASSALVRICDSATATTRLSVSLSRSAGSTGGTRGRRLMPRGRQRPRAC